MFVESGKTLKTVATIWFVITEICVIVGAIILFPQSILWAVILFLSGIFTGYLNLLVMFSIADACVNSAKAAYHLERIIKHVPYIPNNENEAPSKELKESDPCRVCVVCGKVSPASEFICPVCGMGLPMMTVPYSAALLEKTEKKAVSQIVDTLKICEKCGMENGAKTAYCGKCGNKL